MCGLAGFVAENGREGVARERVESAVAALRHRGPDGFGFHVAPAVALGHRRLSIIDVGNGAQPMANEDGTVFTVFNGEIWNHLELRAELEARGHRFKTRADTEVLVHGYEEWGEELVSRLDGMFAFAIWDARRERLLLARDRVGKKPLFIVRTPAGVAFGSDARSVLLTAGLQPRLDRARVGEYLFHRYVCSPRSLYDGVEKLRPGHLATYDRSTYRERAYWRLPMDGDDPLTPEELRGLLRDAVRRRLMSDVPVGVLLSGGVDSAAVLGLAGEAGAEGLASFTVGFDDPLYDERASARAIATRCGSEHHEVVVRRQDFVEALPRLVWFRDEPIAEPSEIPLLLLAELAGRHVKVVLTGDGGDELFGGYPKYRAERILARGGPVARVALAAAARLNARRPSHRRFDRAVETLQIRDSMLRWASWFRSFSPAELRLLLQPELHDTIASALDPIRAVTAEYAALDPARRMLVTDQLTWLPDNMLIRGDKVLMAASVEGRMPLLDRQIVERLAGLSARARSTLRSPKSLLRSAVADLIPAEIVGGPKRGFTVPVARFLFEDEARTLERLVLSDRTLARGIYQPDALRGLVARDARYGANHELKLFTVAALELWLRTCVDELTTEPPTDLATASSSASDMAVAV